MTNLIDLRNQVRALLENDGIPTDGQSETETLPSGGVRTKPNSATTNYAIYQVIDDLVGGKTPEQILARFNISNTNQLFKPIVEAAVKQYGGLAEGPLRKARLAKFLELTPMTQDHVLSAASPHRGF